MHTSIQLLMIMQLLNQWYSRNMCLCSTTVGLIANVKLDYCIDVFLCPIHA